MPSLAAAITAFALAGAVSAPQRVSFETPDGGIVYADLYGAGPGGGPGPAGRDRSPGAAGPRRDRGAGADAGPEAVRRRPRRRQRRRPAAAPHPPAVRKGHRPQGAVDPGGLRPRAVHLRDRSGTAADARDRSVPVRAVGSAMAAPFLTAEWRHVAI